MSRDAGGKWVVEAPTQAKPTRRRRGRRNPSRRACASSPPSSSRPPSWVWTSPPITLTIPFRARPASQLLVGSVTPIQDGYYAQLDGGASRSWTRPAWTQFIGLLKAPPYLATPTPQASPSPAASPTSPIGASATTTLTATVTP